MSRFDVMPSYFQGFQSGQSLVNNGFRNADQMQGALTQQDQFAAQQAYQQQRLGIDQQQHQQQFGLQQQNFNLNEQEFAFRKDEQIRKQQDRKHKAVAYGQVAKQFVLQNPGDPVSDRATLRIIDMSMDRGDPDALEFLMPKLEDAAERHKTVKTFEYLEQNNIGDQIADEGMRAAYKIAKLTKNTKEMTRIMVLDSAIRQREAENQAKEQKEMDEQNDLNVNRERIAGKLATVTAADGSKAGNIDIYNLLESMPPKDVFQIQREVTREGLKGKKPPKEFTTKSVKVKIPMGGDMADMKDVDLIGTEGGTLVWDDNDPVVQSFMEYAKQAQPEQDEGEFDGPWLQTEDQLAYDQRVRKTARELAMKAGWKLAAPGEQGAGAPAGGNGRDFIDDLIEQAMQD